MKFQLWPVPLDEAFDPDAEGWSRLQEPRPGVPTAAWWLVLPSVVVVLVVLLLTSACGPATAPVEGVSVLEASMTAQVPMAIPPAVSTQIDSLLERYSLHPSGDAALVSTTTLDPDEPGATLLAAVSQQIGLGLSAHMGETVRWYSVPLEERSAAGPGNVTADFVVVDGRVVGAGLLVPGYHPNVFALDDGSGLATDAQ